MKFFIVDAFTDNLFGGNPAGVVIIPQEDCYPDEKTMINVAAELGYSETAFVQQKGVNQFKIKYYTPVSEVDLCGHATIASCRCLQSLNLISEHSPAQIETKAGDITVDLIRGKIYMDMALPVLINDIKEEEQLGELYEILGYQGNIPVFYGEITLLPRIISTGLPDIILPLPDVEALQALTPDMERLSDLSEKYEVTGVHAFAISEKGYHCRNFAPLYGIDEEAATGTANGALTYYLHLYGLIDENANLDIIQGEAMNRPSQISTLLTVEGNKCRIRVGGNASIMVEGDLNI